MTTLAVSPALDGSFHAQLHHSPHPSLHSLKGSLITVRLDAVDDHSPNDSSSADTLPSPNASHQQPLTSEHQHQPSDYQLKSEQQHQSKSEKYQKHHVRTPSRTRMRSCNVLDLDPQHGNRSRSRGRSTVRPDALDHGLARPASRRGSASSIGPRPSSPRGAPALDHLHRLPPAILDSTSLLPSNSSISSPAPSTILVSSPAPSTILASSPAPSTPATPRSSSPISALSSRSSHPICLTLGVPDAPFVMSIDDTVDTATAGPTAANESSSMPNDQIPASSSNDETRDTVPSLQHEPIDAGEAFAELATLEPMPEPDEEMEMSPRGTMQLPQTQPGAHLQSSKPNVDNADVVPAAEASPGQTQPLEIRTINPDGSAVVPSLERCKSTTRNRSSSINTTDSESSAQLDWALLDQNEVREQQQRDEATDESMAFLLARLEKENNALATNPKAGLGAPPTPGSPTTPRRRPSTRPPSLQQLKKLVVDSKDETLRYSGLPTPPPMTELEFWSALVSDYASTAQRLPTLTANKIRSGIPAPLRGVVWMSIAGARDAGLEDTYDRLCQESSPYEKMIHKDVGRSFPGVELFREPDGDGQKMLGKVLNAFSLWDNEIGYCQGLGFVVGPLLMHMGDREAFCVLLRLMEHYDLRSCFLPDLSGLHLRLFQFQHLLKQHLPALTAHLDVLKVEPLYISQWFLSFFGVTCPLPMLIRIYDVILTEGASETLMRVALSLMRRNEKRIMEAQEFDDVMQFLLSRTVWDTYGCSADVMVNDFCAWTGLVTQAGLQNLEIKFKESQQQRAAATTTVHSSASRFLGRFWSNSLTSPKSTAPMALNNDDSKRANSKQSISSTLNSGDKSDLPVTPTKSETTGKARHLALDAVTGSHQRSSSVSVLSSKSSLTSPTPLTPSSIRDRDLHSQIEDLLTALSDLQRTHNALSSELQREREEREEDRAAVQKAIDRVRRRGSLSTIREDEGTGDDATAGLSVEVQQMCTDLESQFANSSTQRTSLVLQTKTQLREELARSRAQHAEEQGRTTELSRQLTARDAEASGLREQLRDARARIADGFREQQRLERSNRDLKQQRPPSVIELPESPCDSTPSSARSSMTPPTPQTSTPSSANGLRAFKLGRRSDSTSSTNGSVAASAGVATAAGSTSGGSTTFAKRISSLASSTPNGVNSTTTPSKTETSSSTTEPAKAEQSLADHNDALVLELVASKTAEATAKQELEEVRAKLDALRKLMGAPSTAGLNTSSLSSSTATGSGANTPSSPGGFFRNGSITPSAGQRNGSTTASNGAPTGSVSSAGIAKHGPSLSTSGAIASLLDKDKDKDKDKDLALKTPTTPVGVAGGFFSGWGKRSISGV